MTVWVVYLVFANATLWPMTTSWPTTTPPEFSSAPDCWEWVDHQLESGDLKLGDGVRAVCVPTNVEEK